MKTLQVPQKQNIFGAVKGRYNRINVYQQMIISLSLLVLINSLNAGMQLLINSAIAVASIFVFHYVISKLRQKQEISYESVAISGLLIGLILMPSQPYAVVFASLIAVLSKRIKLNSRHAVNPAMSGVFLSVLLTNSSDAWSGAAELLPVLILGLLVAQKYRRLHLVLPFVFVNMLLSALYKFYNNVQPFYNGIFGGLIYFLAFFMLLEPKTTPIKRNARIVYGVISAVIIFALGLTIPKYAVTGGLLLCNLLVQPLDKLVK